MGRSAAGAYLAVGVCLIGLHVAVGGSNALYSAVGFTTVGLMLIGIAYNRPARPIGWLMLVAGQALFVAGDIVSDASETGWSDVVYLAGYVGLIGGLAVLTRKSVSLSDTGGHVEALLALFAIALSCWLVGLNHSLHLAWNAEQLVAVAYPLGDLICLGLLIRIALAPGVRSLSFYLLFASFAVVFVGDVWYASPSVAGAYANGSWLDVPWLLAYVFAAMAALDPSMRRVGGQAPRVASQLPMVRVAIGGVLLMTLPVCVFIEHALGHGVDATAIAFGGGLLVVGALARVGLLVRDLDRMRRRAEQSERRFRMIFERAPIGISVGKNGVMSDTNPAFQQMLGYSPAELAGMHYTEVTHPDHRALREQVELDAGERDSFSADKQYVRKDGSVVDTRVRMVLDLDDGFGMSLLEDVTEQRRLETSLLEAQKLEAVGKLAGGIAHDFNNLMTAVIGYSDLLLRDPTDEPLPKVSMIREAATRASDLTRQLLAFGRRQTLKAERLDLRDVVAGLDALLRTLAGDQVSLETSLDAEPVALVADRAQLERVLMNLVVNAVTAMPDGGKLSIAAFAEDGDAVLVVADDGVGMDADTVPRIFEPYFSTKPPTEASGLGLATVHGIVGQSGGTIAVRTAPGEGAVFTIRLPQGASLRPLAPDATLV